MLFGPLVWGLAVATALFFAARTWWFPSAISSHAHDYDRQFVQTLIVCGAAFLLLQAALGWLVLRYRDRGQRARGPASGTRLELLWTGVTAVLFFFLMAAGTGMFARVRLDQAPADALRIEVLARQFAWSFRTPGADGRFGRTDLKLVNEAAGNPFGIDPADPAGRDDAVSGSLKVPAGKPVLLLLHSRDVIHSFFVRELRLKQDLVPGMEIPLHFTADRPGVYEIACAELCGLGHHQMRSTLEVLPPSR